MTDGSELKKDVKVYTYVDRVMDKELSTFIEQNEISSKAKLLRDSLKLYLKCNSIIDRNAASRKDYDTDFINEVVIDAMHNYTTFLGFYEELKQHLSPLKTSALLLRKFKDEPEKLGGPLGTVLEAVEHLSRSIKRRFEPQTTSTLFKKVDILHVEDNELDRESIKTYFEHQDISVKSAETVEEALEILRYSAPKAILLDLNLKRSRMQGVEFCERLKAQRKHESIPIVIMTAIVTRAEREQLLEATGAEELIIKPINSLSELDILLDYM